MDNVEEDSKNNIDFNGCDIEIFTHSIELYESYNTYAVISQIKGLMKGEYKNAERLYNDNESTSRDN